MQDSMKNITNNGSIVRIGDLNSEYKFFVPSYQRGYRWTTEEVSQLLDDLYEFYKNKGNNEDDMYCLQPLMVKTRNDKSYEVIDGQQRLTTVYILLKIINDARTRNPLISVDEEMLFSIKYETRKGSESYLKSLNAYCELDDTNIDYYYFTNTIKTFRNWLNVDNATESRFTAVSTMLKEKCFFIWYELPVDTKQSELFELFKKVNVGKIQLTDAELIKAILINKDNFTDMNNDDSSENAKKKQGEIAISWDKIEQGLREDDFWYFFNRYDEKEDKDTRIDIIFELIAKEINKKEKFEISESEKRFTFLVIAKYVKESKYSRADVVDELWQRVEFVYAELRFWYKKNDLYHIIGYLIETKQMDVFQIWDSIADKRKTEQLAVLMGGVKKSVGYKEELVLEDIEYGSTKRDIIRNLLLLHNIASIVIKEDKEIRFPFEIMKKRRWDIEHIHAVNDEAAEIDNGIRNLALLDAKINREYKDAPYNKKRETILEYDKNGRFIPLCTKCVFYKMYTSLDSKSKQDYDKEIWNDYDKEDYLNDMSAVIKKFFEMKWR